MKHNFVAFFFTFFSLNLISQVSYVNNFDNLSLTGLDVKQEIKTHSVFPFFLSDLSHYKYFKEIFPSKIEEKLVIRKLFYEDFYFLKTQDLELRIDPILEFSKGEDNMVTKYKPYENTRGVLVRGKLGSRMFFVSYAIESQRSVPYYIKRYITNRRVVIPGFARFRYYRPDTLDCSLAGGEIFYKMTNNFFISLGRGKNVIGYGYRTHILSFNPPPMTYFKATYTAFDGRLMYSSIFALNNDIQVEGNAQKDILYKGYLNINYLSYYLTKWLQIGMFEAKSFLNSVTAGYFLPVVGWNTLFYPTDSLHRVRFGFISSLRLLKSFMLYGQFLPECNDYQYGLLFSIEKNKFSFFSRIEFNKFNYTHNEILNQEFFSHLNQNIGYSTEDANNELIFDLTIKLHRIGLYYRYNEIKNQYKPNITDDEKRYYRTIEAFVEINPSYRLQIFGRYILHNDEKWITFGLRTNFLGRYIDL